MTNSGCTSFGLIYASSKDTEGTKRQVLNHNQTYDAICHDENQNTQESKR